MTTKAKEVDYQDLLEDSEIYRDERGDEFVYIKGLRRLAKMKGVVKEKFTPSVAVLKRPDTGAEYPFVQVSYEVEFKDGTVWSDCADAHTFNVTGMFRAYPTAMASVRAEGRALRKALGINMVTKEELGASNDAIGEMTGEITPAQKTLIKKLVKSKKVTSLREFFDEVGVKDSAQSVEDLTNSEAKSVISALNKRKVK